MPRFFLPHYALTSSPRSVVAAGCGSTGTRRPGAATRVSRSTPAGGTRCSRRVAARAGRTAGTRRTRGPTTCRVRAGRAHRRVGIPARCRVLVAAGEAESERRNRGQSRKFVCFHEMYFGYEVRVAARLPRSRYSGSHVREAGPTVIFHRSMCRLASAVFALGASPCTVRENRPEACPPIQPPEFAKAFHPVSGKRRARIRHLSNRRAWCAKTFPRPQAATILAPGGKYPG